MVGRSAHTERKENPNGVCMCIVSYEESTENGEEIVWIKKLALVKVALLTQF